MELITIDSVTELLKNKIGVELNYSKQVIETGVIPEGLNTVAEMEILLELVETQFKLKDEIKRLRSLEKKRWCSLKQLMDGVHPFQNLYPVNIDESRQRILDLVYETGLLSDLETRISEIVSKLKIRLGY